MAFVEKISFKSDQFTLIGSLHLPDRQPAPFIVGCHGLFANRQSPKQVALAKACVRLGMAYLRFDHRGCGDSQGTFDQVTSLAARCMDLYHAVRTMQQHPATGRLAGIFGSSFGGTVVLAYSARHQVPRLVTFAAPYSSETVIHAGFRIGESGVAINERLRKALMFDISQELPLVGNVLVSHGGQDELVPVEHARRIHAMVREPKELYIQPGGDHRMSIEGHQQEFLERFVGWVG